MKDRDISILFVDDEKALLNALKRNLIREPYEKIFIESGFKALEIMARQSVHIIITDIKMPKMDGLSLLKKVKEKFPMTIRLVLSGQTELTSILPAINTGEIYRYITKPIEPEQFKKTIQDAIRFYLLNLDRLELVNSLQKRNHELTIALKEKEKAEKALQAAKKKEKQALSRIEDTLLKGQVPDDIKGAAISVLSFSAKDLGGDFHEIIQTIPDGFDILIGDVMGKGILAALVGAGTKQHFLRILGQRQDNNFNKMPLSPGKLTQAVQKKIAKKLITLESFVTLIYARINIKKRNMVLADCGHPQVLIYRSSKKKCEFHKGSNAPIGFMETETIFETCISIFPGDLILFYSDGVIESSSPGGDPFGTEKLAEFIENNHHLPPDDILAKLHQTIDTHTGSGAIEDDITYLCVAIEKPDSKEKQRKEKNEN